MSARFRYGYEDAGPQVDECACSQGQKYVGGEGAHAAHEKRYRDAQQGYKPDTDPREEGEPATAPSTPHDGSDSEASGHLVEEHRQKDQYADALAGHHG